MDFAIRRLRHWAGGYPLTIWLLGLGCFLNVGGLSFLWPVNAIYIHSVLGKPLTVAGLVLMVYSGAGFIGSFLGGWLYDRLGATPVLVSGLAFSGVVILTPVVTTNWYAYIAVMAVFGMTCAMPFPVLNALAGHAWPEGGRRGYNFLYVTNNLGVAVGTAVGGLLAQWSFKAVFIGISAAYLLFVVVVLTVFRNVFAAIGQQRAADKATADAGRLKASDLPAVPWVPIGMLLIGFITAWAIYVQWQATISVYMQSLGFSLASYSLLWTMNGLLIFLAQPLISLVVRRFPAVSGQLIIGMVLFAAAFVLLMAGHSYVVFVLGMVTLTLGELFAWPTVPAAVTQLAPPHRLGLLQGLVGSSATLGRMLGPVAGGYLYDHGSVHALLTAASLSVVVPVVCFLLFARLSRKTTTPGPLSHGTGL